jgi:hypothetical protein
LKKKAKPNPLTFDERAIRKFLKHVHETGCRRSEIHEDFSPADFAAGAGCLLSFCKRLDLMPATWFFGMMLAGQNPFSEKGE